MGMLCSVPMASSEPPSGPFGRGMGKIYARDVLIARHQQAPTSVRGHPQVVPFMIGQLRHGIRHSSYPHTLWSNICVNIPLFNPSAAPPMVLLLSRPWFHLTSRRTRSANAGRNQTASLAYQCRSRPAPSFRPLTPLIPRVAGLCVSGGHSELKRGQRNPEPPIFSPAMEQPFRINVPDSKLELLAKKLELAELPDELEEAGWAYGVPLTDIQRLVARWKSGYDWRKHETAFNEELPQYQVSIEVEGFGSLTIHYVHKRSRVQKAIPLLFVHGCESQYLLY